MAEAEAAVDAVDHLAASVRGTLRVNAPMSFGATHLAPALADFMPRCPELRIDLTLNDRQVDLVEEGYDLAVRIGTLGRFQSDRAHAWRPAARFSRQRRPIWIAAAGRNSRKT